jgi:hypothetical protein
MLSENDSPDWMDVQSMAGIYGLDMDVTIVDAGGLLSIFFQRLKYGVKTLRWGTASGSTNKKSSNDLYICHFSRQ